MVWPPPLERWRLFFETCVDKIQNTFQFTGTMKRTSKISRRIVATLLGSALGTCFCSAIMLDAEMLFAGIAMLTLSLVIAAIIY